MKNTLLPEKLKALRKAHGYNQDYIAEYLGVVRQTYSHYETGKRVPSPDTLFKLALLYQISTDDLMQLSVELDPNVYYDAPAPSQSSQELSDFLAYFNNPYNAKKYRYFNNLEKELLYYFEKISDSDRWEIIEFIKIKARKKKIHTDEHK